MDAFYASVEMLDNPLLKGKPVIVGGSRKRGVVSAASYEARKYGVHSAQPMARAIRLCPQGVFLPVRMERYQEISSKIFAIFSRYTPLVETLSIDEAFLDVTNSQRLFGSPAQIAGSLKKCVYAEIGLTASAGVAPSKFVAKIASDMHKPDGLTVVHHDEVQDFLDPLPIEKLWGVGAVTRNNLAMLGVRTVCDLRRIPCHLLERKFGRHGIHLYRLARGRDERRVEPQNDLQSIGCEETCEEDIVSLDTAKCNLLGIATRLSRRLRSRGMRCKTISLKVKYSDFTQITRSITLPDGIDDGRRIYNECCSLLHKTETGRRAVRLLGISVASLICADGASRQLELFSDGRASARTRALNSALDYLQNKFGEGTVVSAAILKNK